MKKSDQLKQEMKTTWDGIKAIQEAVVKESREYTQAERDSIEKALDNARAIELQIEKEQKDEAMAARVKEFDKLFEQKAEQSHQAIPANGRQKSGGSLGHQFINSPEWQAWLKRVAPEGRIPDSLKGLSSPPINVKSLGLFERKELITGASDVSAGAFVVPDQSGIYEPLGRYPLTLRQLIDVRTTTSDSVEFVRQTAQVTQATTVAESNVTTYSGATGEVSGEKPEGTSRWERVQEVVKTIAVWIPATKRSLSDAGQLRGLIDSELRADVAEELENQLLNGNGLGENFTGLNNTAGTLVQTFNADIVSTARRAITNLLINGRQIPTAYLFNPRDWETYDLMQDLEGRYYWGGPMAQGPKTLWGVPVAQSFFQAQGIGWLANWRKMVLWDREQATISVSDSHSDFFIRNMVAILCELRAAMGVIRPTAFVEIDLETS